MRVKNRWFSKQPAECRDFFCRRIEGRIERLPLLIGQDEAGLLNQHGLSGVLGRQICQVAARHQPRPSNFACSVRKVRVG
jgi:hypothetical protein